MFIIPPLESGRLEKRDELVLPVHIVELDDRGPIQPATTENVCSRGLRILARRPLKANERLWIGSPSGDGRAQARVVYCERLPDGRYAAGLELARSGISWLTDRSSVTSESY